MLTFATRTWDGWDYIPDVWDRWLAAADGVLLVAAVGGAAAVDADGSPLEEGQPVAVTRLVMLSEDECWLEGIRVDPRVRGMNVATDLQVAELRWAVAHGMRVIRYATGQDNEGSHRLGARHGITLLGAWLSYGVDDEDEEIPPAASAAAVRPGLATVAESDADRWWARVVSHPTLRAGHGLYERRPWAMQELTEERFRGHVARGQVTVWPGTAAVGGAGAGPSAGAASAGAAAANAVATSGAGAGSSPADSPWALAIARDEGWGDEDPLLPASPALLIGDGRASLELLRAMSGGRPGVPRVRLPAVDPPILDAGTLSAWTDAGWKPRDGALHILSRALDASHPLPEPEDTSLLEMEDEPRPIAVPWSPPQ
ncbi:MAG: GNAT family N-acetyltransferase [Chloroflexota bacterium]|nr:GNAT family N-acetyltransferase [Chloroflexota bacterium]